MQIRSWTEWWRADETSNDDPIDGSFALNDVSILERTSRGEDVEAISHFKENDGVVAPTRPIERTRKLLLDIRESDEYLKRHLVCTDVVDDNQLVVVHIPLSELLHRRFELPPRHEPFAILLTPPQPQRQFEHDDEISQGAEDVDSLLHRLVSVLSGESGKDPCRRLTCPWNVSAIILASLDETWQQAQDSGIESVSSDTRDLSTTNTLKGSFRPDPRLWCPDSMVEHVLLPLLIHEFSDSLNAEEEQRPLEIWDLGAGVGRDVCFLSEELRAIQRHERPPSFLVVGLDQRYRNVQCNDAIEFWKRRRVDAVTCCRCVDLNDADQVSKLIMGDVPDELSVSNAVGVARKSVVKCFLSVRFWNKPLFAMLVQAGYDNRLHPGTMVAISQFGKPYVNAPWDFPHPKEKHVLERDELRKLFIETVRATDPPLARSWTILHDQVVRDSDHGRTLIQFVAMLQ